MFTGVRVRMFDVMRFGGSLASVWLKTPRPQAKATGRFPKIGDLKVVP